MEVLSIVIIVYSQIGKLYSAVLYLLRLSFIHFFLCRSFFSTAFQSSSSTKKIDEFIQKLDIDVRRMGRVSKREIEQILNEINISSEYFHILKI